MTRPSKRTSAQGSAKTTCLRLLSSTFSITLFPSASADSGHPFEALRQKHALCQRDRSVGTRSKTSICRCEARRTTAVEAIVGDVLRQLLDAVGAAAGANALEADRPYIARDRAMKAVTQSAMPTCGYRLGATARSALCDPRGETAVRFNTTAAALAGTRSWR